MKKHKELKLLTRSRSITFLFSIIITTILSRISIPEGISFTESAIIFVMFQCVNVTPNAWSCWLLALAVISASWWRVLIWGVTGVGSVHSWSVILRCWIWACDVEANDYEVRSMKALCDQLFQLIHKHEWCIKRWNLTVKLEDRMFSKLST